MKKLFSLVLTVLALSMGTVSAETQMVRLTRFEGMHLTGVSASNAFQVEIIPSGETKVVVEVPAEYERFLILEMSSSGVVRLGLEAKGRNLNLKNRSLRAKIYLTNLREIKASSAASITTSGLFETESLLLDASSAGGIHGLNVKTAGRVSVSANSAARVSGIIHAGTLKLDASSASGIDLETTSISLNCEASSASNIKLNGKTDNLVASASSAASIKASDLDSKTVNFTASSGASIRIGNAGTLQGSASSGASIRYTSGVLTNVSITSGASVKKATD